VKRVIARESDTVRIVDGRVYVNDIRLHDEYVRWEFPQPDELEVRRSSSRATTSSWATIGTTLRQPPLGSGAKKYIVGK